MLTFIFVAGKGRSGTVAASYLIAYEDYDTDSALELFTEKRMKVGKGVSIPSQVRWVRYVDYWHKNNQQYKDMISRLSSVQINGMRDMDLQVGIAQFVDSKHMGRKNVVETVHIFTREETTKNGGDKVTCTPQGNIVIPADVCIFLCKNTYGIDSKMPVSLSHCWLNVYFEYIIQKKNHNEKLIVSIEWKDMDGIGGTNKKIVQAFDSIDITFDQ